MYNCMRTTKTNRFNSQYGRNTISDDIKYKNIKKESLHTISQYLISVPGTLLQKKAHFKLCKYSIKVRKKATNRAVMGELGRYPLFLEVLLNIIKYWIRLSKINILLRLLPLRFSITFITPSVLYYVYYPFGSLLRLLPLRFSLTFISFVDMIHDICLLFMKITVPN